MDDSQLSELLSPHMVGTLKDGFELACRTFVLDATNPFLGRFGDMLLVAAAQGELVPGEGYDLDAARRRLEWAIRDGRLYRLPNNMVVSSLDELCGLTGYRVALTPLYKKLSDEEKAQKKKPDIVTYVARFSPKAILSSQATPLGVLETLWVDGQQAVRILRVTEWKDLYETAKSVSRVLPIGLREMLLLTQGALPSQPANSVQALIHQINGITAVVLSTRNPNEIKDVQLLTEAKAVMSVPSMGIRSLSSGEIAGRIPTVVPPERVIVSAGDLSDRGSNSVIEQITGFTGTALLYGATDLAGNWVELLQLYIACMRSGLPGVFDIDIRAHTLGSYWERILQPSVALIGGAAALPQSMYGLNGNEITMAQLMGVLELPRIDGAAHLIGLPVTDFYVALHQEFVDRLNQLTGAQVQIAVRTASRLFGQVGENLAVGHAVDLIRAVLNEDRVFGTGWNGKKFRLSDIPFDQYDWSVTHWMNIFNAWPGGTVTYLLMAVLAHYGPVVLNLKDSRLGNVSKMAFVDLGIGSGNQALAAISGVTRCYPKYATKSGGDNLDLLILFEMMERYPERVVALIQAMVDRWIFPLTLSQAGLAQTFSAVYAGGWYYNRYWESPNGSFP